MGLSASQMGETDASKFRALSGNVGKPRRCTRKEALEGFLRVSFGLNAFSVREEMLEPCLSIRCH